MYFILLSSLVSSSSISPVSQNYCNIYSCKPASFPFSNTTCIYPDLLHSTYYLNPCSSSLPYCNPNLTSLVNVTCAAKAPAPILQSYPGEPCNSTANCLYGTCLSGVCFGSNPGESCNTSANCNPGLRCSGGTCKALIAAGSTGCTSDYDCDSTSGCNKNSTTGLCTSYFSLKPDAKVSQCTKEAEGGYSYLCTTGVCLIDSIRSSAGVCSEAPVSVKPNPSQCLSNDNCQGVTSQLNYTGICTCGINPYATSYCQPFMGDVQGKSYLAALKAFFMKDYANQCNTMRRYSPQCWSLFMSTPEYQALFKAKLVFYYYPQLQNNDICIETIVFNDYYHIVSFGWNLAFAALWLVS